MILTEQKPKILVIGLYKKIIPKAGQLILCKTYKKVFLPSENLIINN